MSKTEDILQQRKTSHGEYLEHADVAQGILEECMRGRNWATLPRAMRESLHMFAHKMARVVTGNPYHEDHWDDISGYAVLISQRMDRLRQQPGPAQMRLAINMAEQDVMKMSQVQDMLRNLNEFLGTQGKEMVVHYGDGRAPSAADRVPDGSELSPRADSPSAGATVAPGAAHDSGERPTRSEPLLSAPYGGDAEIDPPNYALAEDEELPKNNPVPHQSPILELSHQRQPRDATDAEYKSFANQLVPAGNMKGVHWQHLYEESAADDGRWKMFPSYHEEYGS